MTDSIDEISIRIMPWANDDLTLLFLMNSHKMMKYLGGPESYDQLLGRHKLYQEIGNLGMGQMYSIILLPYQQKVGVVGYWNRFWRNKEIYEIGWGVLPQYQGQGIATIAVAKAIEFARKEQKHRYIHAFPSINNYASNAICRKLNFKLFGTCDFEYPLGSVMQSNDWRLKIGSKKDKST